MCKKQIENVKGIHKGKMNIDRCRQRGFSRKWQEQRMASLKQGTTHGTIFFRAAALPSRYELLCSGRTGNKTNSFLVCIWGKKTEEMEFKNPEDVVYRAPGCIAWFMV